MATADHRRMAYAHGSPLVSHRGRLVKVRMFIVVIALAMVIAPVASARNMSSKQMQVKLHQLQSKINYAKRFIAKDREALRTNREWVATGPYVAILVTPVDHFLKHQHLQLMKRIVKRTEPRYKALRERYLASLLPAHYTGWMCIHRSEGAWYSVNPNGHYNGLQMTLNWLGIIKGNPNNYTPMEILRAAETGYANSHYSRHWLQGQWGQTISPCWQFFE